MHLYFRVEGADGDPCRIIVRLIVPPDPLHSPRAACGIGERACLPGLCGGVSKPVRRAVLLVDTHAQVKEQSTNDAIVRALAGKLKELPAF